MTSTITLRLPAAQRAALKKRAAALQKSESALLRELVARETAEETFAGMVERWAGVLDSRKATRPPHPMAVQSRERNWRQ